MSQPTVFLCYHPADADWKDRLARQLEVPEQSGKIRLWDDSRILAGDDAPARLAQAVDAARVAVLLVSADFLASPSLQDEQVPRLLERRREDGLRVVPVIVRPCLWETVDWLNAIEVRPRGRSALSTTDASRADAELVELAREILGLATGDGESGPLETTAVPSRDKLLRRILQWTTDDGPGVALLEPLGFGARLVVERFVDELGDPKRPEVVVARLVPDWRSVDEARLYRGLFRSLWRGLPGAWRDTLGAPPSSKDEFNDVLYDLLDGPVTREGRTLVVVLEGLEKIGEEQLEDWAWLIDVLTREQPMKVLAWGREELHNLCTGYRGVRTDSPFQRLRRLEVGSYDEDDVARLLDGDGAARLVYDVTGGHPALVDEVLERGLDELRRGDEQGLRDRVLASPQLRTLRHEVGRDDAALGALERIVGGDLSRHFGDDGEERLRWLGIVVEDGASSWRWTSPVRW